MGAFVLLFFISAYSSYVFSFDNAGYRQAEEKIENYIEANPDVTLNYQLIYQGRVVVMGAHGSQRKEGSSVYRAGSLAKIFTALGIMLLEERGLIDIDQPVAAYLPRFKINRRFTDDQPITVRHVLTHHAGLPTDIVKGQWSNEHFTTVIEQLRHEYLTYPPDFVMAYSNVGYSILGALIEEVSGQSYESYIREVILHPLDMMGTGFADAAISSPDFINAYVDGKLAKLLPIRDIPAMGLFTTAEDMGKLLIMMTSGGEYQGRKIIDKESLEEMFEYQNSHVALDYDTQVGLGLTLNHCKFKQAETEIERGGSTMHYSAHVVALPESHVAAVVLSNSSQAKKLVHSLASELVGSVVKSDTEVGQDSPTSVNQLDNPGSSEVVSGTYLTRSGLLKLNVDEKDLCACINDKRLNLMPAPDGWYRVVKDSAKSSSLKITSQQVEGKKVIVVNKDGREIRLGEYIPEEDIPDAWRNRLGDYQVSNPDLYFPLADVRLIEKDNLIHLSYRMPRLSASRIDLPLTALNNMEAVTSGLGRGRGETIKVMKTDDGEFLLYSGFLLEKRVADIEDFW